MKISFIMFVPVMHNLLLDRILFSLMSVRLKQFLLIGLINPRFGGDFF